MATTEQRNHAKSFLKKADEYLASAEDNLAAQRHTPAAGDAIHAGISSKDAIVTMLTGSTSKGKDHATAAKELKQALLESAKLTAMIFTVIWGVLIFTRFLGFVGLPNAIAEWVVSLNMPPMAIMVAI